MYLFAPHVCPGSISAIKNIIDFNLQNVPNVTDADPATRTHFRSSLVTFSRPGNAGYVHLVQGLRVGPAALRSQVLEAGGHQVVVAYAEVYAAFIVEGIALRGKCYLDCANVSISTAATV